MYCSFSDPTSHKHKFGNFPRHMPCDNGGQFAAETWIVLICVPIFITFGVTGNIFSILVMCRKAFRTNSTSVFVITLAVCDIVYLFSNSLVNHWIEAVCCINIQKLSNASCKACKYLIYATKFIGAWILVSVAAERYIVVVYPFKSKTVCTLTRTKYYVSCLTTFVLLLHIYIPVVMTNTPSNSPYCEIDENISHSVQVTLHILDLVFYSFVPSILIIILNAGLCFKLNQRRKAVPALVSFSKALVQEDSLRLNLTLIMISITFLVCTLPFAILMVFNSVHRDIDTGSSRIAYSSLNSLNLLNSAVNFLLYCVSGPKFRAELKEMLEEFIQKFSLKKNSVGQHPLSHMTTVKSYPTPCYAPPIINTEGCD